MAVPRTRSQDAPAHRLQRQDGYNGQNDHHRDKE